MLASVATAALPQPVSAAKARAATAGSVAAADPGPVRRALPMAASSFIGFSVQANYQGQDGNP